MDEAGFAAAMEEQRQRSKKSWKEGGLAAMSSGVRDLMKAGRQARFVGYESRSVATVMRPVKRWPRPPRVPEFPYFARKPLFTPRPAGR